MPQSLGDYLRVFTMRQRAWRAADAGGLDRRHSEWVGLLRPLGEHHGRPSCDARSRYGWLSRCRCRLPAAGARTRRLAPPAGRTGVGRSASVSDARSESLYDTTPSVCPGRAPVPATDRGSPTSKVRATDRERDRWPHPHALRHCAATVGVIAEPTENEEGPGPFGTLS